MRPCGVTVACRPFLFCQDAADFKLNTHGCTLTHCRHFQIRGIVHMMQQENPSMGGKLKQQSPLCHMLGAGSPDA